MKHWGNEDNSDILDIKYEDLVSDTKKTVSNIWGFCNFKGKYDENIRKKYFAQTASKFQVTQSIYATSLKKEEFEGQKEEFSKNLELQRQYWASSS